MPDYPVRHCPHCRGSSVVVTVLKQYVGFIPGGTQLTYQCRSCQRTFPIEPLTTHILHSLGGVLALALGALLAVSQKDGERMASYVFIAGGAVALLYVAFRRWRELRSPPVQERPTP